MIPDRAQRLYAALSDSDREAICVAALQLVECWTRETALQDGDLIPDADALIDIENEAQDLLDTFQEITASAIGTAEASETMRAGGTP